MTSITITQAAKKRKPTLNQIDKVATMMGRRFGSTYEVDYLWDKLNCFYRDLLPAGEKPVMLVDDVETLLNPVEMATRLGWAGNAQRVNTILEALGYQQFVEGKWYPIDNGLDYCEAEADPQQLYWSLELLAEVQRYELQLAA